MEQLKGKLLSTSSGDDSMKEEVEELKKQVEVRVRSSQPNQ